MTPRVWLGHAAFAAVYAASVVAARFTVIEGGTISLIWPATGVSFLWLLAQRDRRSSGVVLVGMCAVLGVVLTVTGAAWWLIGVGIVASLTETVVAVTLFRRFCPGLWGSGGTASVHTPGMLARASGAAVLGTFASALVGTAGVALFGAPDGLLLLELWGRDLAGLMVVGAVGHLGWEWLRGEAPAGEPRRRAELVALILASATVYAAVFGQNALPLAFIPPVLSVWCGLRFTTLTAAVHASLCGAAVAALTVAGWGVFAGNVDTPEVRALVTQVYLITTLLTAMTVSTSHDERSALVAGLAESESRSAKRAELLDAMNEAMSDGLIVFDADGEMVKMNPAARQMLARVSGGFRSNTREYEIRLPDGAVLSPEDHPSRRALREGEVARHDIVIDVDDGESRVLSVSASALTGGDLLGSRRGALVVYRDVTAERQQANQLAEFAEVVAHDLRAPLTVARGWLDMAARDEVDLDPTTRKALDRIRTTTDRMGELIGDLLAQATAEGGRLELAAVDLGGTDGLVARIAAELAPGASVRVEGVPTVLADEDLLEQLLRNLIGNAVKYVAPEVAARVVVSGCREGQRVVVEVTDNGIGIPADQRAEVFDRFHRAHAGDDRYRGTGLGLAICRTIVERHGGRIRCEDAVGQASGTTFRFDLPAFVGSDPAA